MTRLMSVLFMNKQENLPMTVNNKVKMTNFVYDSHAKVNVYLTTTNNRLCMSW